MTEQTQQINNDGIKALMDDVQGFMEMQHVYSAAIKALQTRLEILNDEFKVCHAQNPIHHIESRVKSPESIYKKLKKRGCEISTESARRNLNDIAGVRVVCCYIDDVYKVAEMLLRQSDIRLIKRKDYITEPNYNGYRSLHIDVELPVYLSNHTEYVAVEIQLRTVAMDFWASLEHDLHYKSEKFIPRDITDEMIECADRIAQIDSHMQDIYKRIQKL